MAAPLGSGLLVLLLLVIAPSDGQLLSKGASDWYMRFHNKFMKRNIDKPVTRSFHVRSEIRHRYAVTEVKAVVHNPATNEQTFEFGFVMARTALVSNVTLSCGSGTVVKSTVDASNWALTFMREHDDRSNGSNVHDEEEEEEALNYLHHRADFKQFVLPFSIRPMDEVTVRLVYEYLLERTDNRYVHTLSVSPGEIVEDFQIALSIEENRPLEGVAVTAPIIGEIGGNSEASSTSWEMVFNMSRVDQYDHFGRHGYTGDLKASYDLVATGGDAVDLVVQDDFFVHFYHVPRRMAISKHFIFLLDASESMRGPKLGHAKRSVEILVGSMSDSQFMNLFVFDDGVREWHPNATSSTGMLLEAFPCTNATLTLVSRYLEGLESAPGTVANITYALERAIDLDDRLWAISALPDNSLTMVVLLTDGRSAAGNGSEAITRRIRQLNRSVKIPVFALGIGFDANTEFLEDLAEASCGKTCTGYITEDLDAELQWKPVQGHLNDVVLKKFKQDYIGEAFVGDSLTKRRFNVFHQGGSVAVAGQFNVDDPFSQFEVESTGQSADGYYVDRPPATPFVTNGCRGSATLCTGPSFQGGCLTVNGSTAALSELEFDDKAVSMNITGTCAWIAYENGRYGGRNITLMPGEHEGLPGEVHKRISSLRIVAKCKLDGSKNLVTASKRPNGSNAKSDNSVARLWAFVTIKDVLERAADDATTKAEIEKAYSLAMKYNFLTPFTDIYFSTMNPNEDEVNLVEPEWQILGDNQLTYGDLSPIFYPGSTSNRQWEALKSCDAPIRCEGNFHYEEYVEEELEHELVDEEDVPAVHRNGANCTGSLTLYTQPDFQGESLRVENSVRQLYHSTNSQRMRSIRSEGTCCWLLMDHRFFAAGTVEKFCGDKEERFRQTNIGSIKRMHQPI